VSDMKTLAKHMLELKVLIDDLKNKTGDLITDLEIHLNSSLNSSFAESNSSKYLNEISQLANQLDVFLKKRQSEKQGFISDGPIRSLVSDIENTVYLEERAVQEQLLKTVNQTISSMVNIQDGLIKAEKIRNILDTVLKIKQTIHTAMR
jgi:hypothetical protein